MYGRGMSYSGISSHVQEMYGISVSKAAISAVTDKIIESFKGFISPNLQQNMVNS